MKFPILLTSAVLGISRAREYDETSRYTKELFEPHSHRQDLGKSSKGSKSKASKTTKSIKQSRENAYDLPYGTWPSPITSESITAGVVGLKGVKFLNGDLYWLEGRPEEGGRTVLCKYAPEDPNKNERDCVDMTPSDSYVRTRVHEYGGGQVVYGKNESEIFYSNDRDQRLYQVVGDESSKPITEEGNRFRYADGVLTKDGKTIYCIREDHLNPAPSDIINELVAINVEDGSMEVVATGNDFYSAPRLSPDEKRLAFITWNHPNMPWDATELRVADLDDPNSDHLLVAGGDGDTSVLQPAWHPQTNDLFYISDKSGWYNIYRASGSESIIPMDAEFGGESPGWILGQQGYDFLPDGRIIAEYSKGINSVLVVADASATPVAIQEFVGKNDGLPMLIGAMAPGMDGDIYFVGGSPSTPDSIYKWNMESKTSTVLARSSNVMLDEDLISVPKVISFPTTLGTAYGYYYSPKNRQYYSSTESAPPVIVQSHGGPTGATNIGFSATYQYWTSRGFALFDIDYGGSTGYGREYRRRLLESWGIVDVDDVSNGALYLAQHGLADGERLLIDGGSAGGYTTLSALAFKSVFKAGASLYGVADLKLLAGETHKFESRYLDSLLGEYDEDLYNERSPINSLDTFDAPILFLHGADDTVVPPNQSEEMYNALVENGIATSIKIYEGESHGFRKSENIQDALDRELAFYGKIFHMDIPGAIEIEIDNLKRKRVRSKG